MNKPLSRRALLARTGTLAAGMMLSLHMPRPLAAAAAKNSTQPEVLTPEQWSAVEAISACIIPTDHEPGAREANCVNFIDKALAREDALALPMYQAGIAALNQATLSKHGKRFEQLSQTQQLALLKQLESGQVSPWKGPAELPQQLFFENLRIHTLVAFLAAPQYGGNRNHAGWRVTGYPGGEHHRGGYSAAQIKGEAPITPIWLDAGQAKEGYRH